jgi:hypothetical protein
MTKMLLIDLKNQHNDPTNKAGQPIRFAMTCEGLQMSFLNKYSNRHFQPKGIH